MDEFDKPAVLEAPIPGDDALSDDGEVKRIQPKEISAADRLSADKAADQAFAMLRKQPTEKIRVPKVNGPQVVIVNGARFNIPANVQVEVPQQVAEILRDAGRI